MRAYSRKREQSFVHCSGEERVIVVKENNLSFIAVVKNECSPLLIVDFLTQIIAVFKTYIGTVNEVKIRGNFSIVYQARSS